MPENVASLEDWLQKSSISEDEKQELKNVIHHHLFTSLTKIMFPLCEFEEEVKKMQKEVLKTKQFFK